MSKALFHVGQSDQTYEALRFWSHEEIVQRESAIRYIELRVEALLKRTNPAWQLRRFEAPTLVPTRLISPEHLSSGDVFRFMNSNMDHFAMRAETTASSYRILEELLTNTNDYNLKLPLCVYQVGKSYRTEKSDGATAAKLRYNEFYQMEFQCAYSSSTMKDYFDLLPDLAKVLNSFLYNWNVEIVESDRLPVYSKKTMDLMAVHDHPGGRIEFEIASISKRTDFDMNPKLQEQYKGIEVFEIAIGLDRLVELMGRQ